jgi:PAS domain S-box-containing protein
VFVSEKQKCEELEKRIKYLENIISLLPGHVYWKDINCRFLGCNNLQAIIAGFNFPKEIIGKSSYDAIAKNQTEAERRDQANKIDQIDKQIMETGIEQIVEEPLVSEDGTVRVFLSHKVPLYDEQGHVLGILGTSIDITAEKESEQLKVENEKQKTLLAEEEKFKKLANQVAHDIRSPLASLSMIVRGCTQIPESNRIALREAAMGITDIANNLLHQYNKNEIDSSEIEERQPVLVSTVLSDILTAKKYQYQNLPIKFNCHFDVDTQFSFIKIEPSAFKRTLSNLINNAVDAFDNSAGNVELQLAANIEWVKITIQDSGKGMPQELINKIMSKISVTSGKESGHGIGLTQVWETLDRNQGELYIDSKLGQGTTITLTFSRIKAPTWIAEEIILMQNDTVIILDDDTSIHQAWRTRFEGTLNNQNNIQLKHFQQGKEALEFLSSLKASEKQNIFLLSDYELLQQDLNGLHIIAQSEIRRSILVTSHYADILVQKHATSISTKILPKQLASEILIKIIEVEEINSVYNIVDVVLVDDDEIFSNNLVTYIFGGKVVDQYLNPEDLLKNVHRYTKDTKIYLDNNYFTSMRTGIDVAKELHEKGYERLYLLSGEVFEKGKVPNYLTVIRKDDIDGIENSL